MCQILCAQKPCFLMPGHTVYYRNIMIYFTVKHILCILFVGTQQPSMRFLNRYVRDSVGLKWHDLGIELLDSNNAVEDLDTIEAEHSTDLKKCCTKMFNMWLRKQPQASWNQLIEALRQPNIELDTLATKIEGMLLQPKAKG